MQSANILLALGGDSGNQVPKYGVTAAEIAVLRAIHGEESVTDVLPIREPVNRTNRAELSRLRSIYSGARDNDGNIIVDMLFPGAAARVFETIEELELPPELFAAKERVSSNTAPTKENKPAGLDGLKVPALRKIAEDKKIDLGGLTKKSDIIAKIEAAGVTAASEPETKTLNDLTDEQLTNLAEENDVDIEGVTDRAEIISLLNDAGVSIDDLEDEVGVLG